MRDIGRTVYAPSSSTWLVLVALGFAIAGCTSVDPTDSRVDDRPRVASSLHDEVVSDGGFVAGFVEGDPSGGVQMLVPVIRDAGGQVVYEDHDAYSTRHGVGLVWHAEGATEALWILSGDIGTARVAETEDGTWTKEWTADLPEEIAELADR